MTFPPSSASSLLVLLNLGRAEVWPCTPLPGKACLLLLLGHARVWVWTETLPCGAVSTVLEWIFLSQDLLSCTGVAQIFPLVISP